MKLTINGFSQEQMIKYELDYSDINILDYIIFAVNNDNMISYIDENNKKYIWLLNGKILEDLPTLYIGERHLIRKLDNLIEKGFIEKIIKGSGAKKKTYYKITQKTLNMRYGVSTDSEDVLVANDKVEKEIKNPKVEEMFKTFWEIYPRKSDKKKAYICFAKIKNLEDEFENIIKGLNKQREIWVSEKTKINYIPLPTTWLNGERWNDDFINNLDNSNVSKVTGKDYTREKSGNKNCV